MNDVQLTQALIRSVKNHEKTSLFHAKHIHLVGIKGVAMTSMAQCLLDLGIRVSGSDVQENFVTQQQLAKSNYKIFSGFAKNHITSDIDMVIYTGAHRGSQNVEVMYARELGISTLTHAEALGQLMDTRRGISICGTGGKSTTTAMIAWILESAGIRPCYSIGVGNVENRQRTGRYRSNQSEWFVAEADEYAVDPLTDTRPRFIYQHPETIVVTNLTYDHPDIYATFNDQCETFTSFLRTAKESVYVNADCQTLLRLFTDSRETGEINFESCSVGFSESADYQVAITDSREGKTTFKITYRGICERQPFLADTAEWYGELAFPGEFNIINAALAFLVCTNEAGVRPEQALEALAKFKGTMRRFEYKGKLRNTTLCYDDYAHTPDEIKNTLCALKTWYPTKKIIAIFQPHTYSRTKALLDQFAQSFTSADEVYLLDIFASAREEIDPHISSALLEEKLVKNSPSLIVKNMKTIEAVKKYVCVTSPENSVYITLGAGDVYKMYDDMELQ